MDRWMIDEEDEGWMMMDEWMDEEIKDGCMMMMKDEWMDGWMDRWRMDIDYEE